MTARLPVKMLENESSSGCIVESHKVRAWTISNKRVINKKLQIMMDGRREYRCSIRETTAKQRLETNVVVVEAIKRA